MRERSGRPGQLNLASVCTCAFLALLVLKLTGLVTWSWWLVTLPLWGQLALLPLFFAGSLFLMFELPKRLSSEAEAETVVEDAYTYRADGPTIR
jgi:hypothetical protein